MFWCLYRTGCSFCLSVEGRVSWPANWQSVGGVRDNDNSVCLCARVSGGREAAGGCARLQGHLESRKDSASQRAPEPGRHTPSSNPLGLVEFRVLPVVGARARAWALQISPHPPEGHAWDQRGLGLVRFLVTRTHGLTTGHSPNPAMQPCACTNPAARWGDSVAWGRGKGLSRLLTSCVFLNKFLTLSVSLLSHVQMGLKQLQSSYKNCSNSHESPSMVPGRESFFPWLWSA